MKRGELAVKLERWEPLAPCAACFLLTAVLCGAQLFGGYAPFALGLVAAAGSGKRGLAALLGGVAGALVFLDFSHALRTLAVAVLLYTAPMMVMVMSIILFHETASSQNCRTT